MSEPSMLNISGPTRKMNRLILVGNGFDLAHKMKTSYNHFILDYIISCFSFAEDQTKKSYIDEAFQINLDNNRVYFFPNKLGTMTDIITMLYVEGKINDLFTGKAFCRGSESLINSFKIKVKMPFIEHILRKCSLKNWVDIENEYYEKLKGTLEHPSKKGKDIDIEELNLAMKWLIDKLQTYLAKLDFDYKQIAEFEELFRAPIDSEDFADEEYYSTGKISVEQTHVLNFNYTSTVKQYVSNGDRIYNGVQINNIHGKLNAKDNPVIFGFGDELDKDYVTLELDKSKGLFEHIKSFWYFKTSNYYNLIRFIDTNDFQVYVFGHSCGLSDRTMLNMIFEHERCKSIKIFYHGTKEDNNYTALTQEISRHFKDKRLMRRRIVSLDRSSPMPQAT